MGHLAGVDSACPTMRRLNGFGALRHQLESRESFRDFEINIVKDGKPGVWSLSARPVYDSDGNFTVTAVSVATSPPRRKHAAGSSIWHVTMP